MRARLALGLILAAVATASAARAAVDCVPVFQGPVAETAASPGYVRDTFVPAGYVSEEFFVGCQSAVIV